MTNDILSDYQQIRPLQHATGRLVCRLLEPYLQKIDFTRSMTHAQFCEELAKYVPEPALTDFKQSMLTVIFHTDFPLLQIPPQYFLTAAAEAGAEQLFKLLLNLRGSSRYHRIAQLTYVSLEDYKQLDQHNKKTAHETLRDADRLPFIFPSEIPGRTLSKLSATELIRLVANQPSLLKYVVEEYLPCFKTYFQDQDKCEDHGFDYQNKCQDHAFSAYRAKHLKIPMSFEKLPIPILSILARFAYFSAKPDVPVSSLEYLATAPALRELYRIPMACNDDFLRLVFQNYVYSKAASTEALEDLFQSKVFQQFSTVDTLQQLILATDFSREDADYLPWLLEKPEFASLRSEQLFDKVLQRSCADFQRSKEIPYHDSKLVRLLEILFDDLQLQLPKFPTMQKTLKQLMLGTPQTLKLALKLKLYDSLKMTEVEDLLRELKDFRIYSAEHLEMFLYADATALRTLDASSLLSACVGNAAEDAVEICGTTKDQFFKLPKDQQASYLQHADNIRQAVHRAGLGTTLTAKQRRKYFDLPVVLKQHVAFVEACRHHLICTAEDFKKFFSSAGKSTKSTRNLRL